MEPDSVERPAASDRVGGAGFSDGSAINSAGERVVGSLVVRRREHVPGVIVLSLSGELDVATGGPEPVQRRFALTGLEEHLETVEELAAVSALADPFETAPSSRSRATSDQAPESPSTGLVRSYMGRS